MTEQDNFLDPAESIASDVSELDDSQQGRELLQATRPFANESIKTSWRHVITVFILVIAVLTAAGLASGWPTRTAFSVLGALLLVRTFIMYHDYMHGAILRDSRIAALLFHVYSWFGLVPTKSWSKSHNYHHGHVGQISWDAVGAFPLVTVGMWKLASRAERAQYRATRHPLIVLFGYVTVFAFSITLLPLLREPSRHWDSALALLAHGGMIAALWVLGGFDNAFFVVLLPMTLSAVLGSYLFFAQHNCTSLVVHTPKSWTIYQAAMKSSSYMRLSKIMRWFTGNIGYHHIHHLNVRIPFYRLPEASVAIPAAQSPITTSLTPREIVSCFRASLWDEGRQRMVSYRQAARN